MTPEQSRRVAELVDQWESSLLGDETVEVDELCRRDPALKGEVSLRISEILRMREEIHRETSAENQPDVSTVSSKKKSSGDSATSSPDVVVETSVEKSLQVHLPAGTTVRFEKIQLHAVGGLGEVYIAEDTELKRRVALKEIQERASNHESTVSRFVREAEVTGQLEHPGIVPVYGLGFHEDGRPYYAMKFIKGDSLDKAIQQFHEAHGTNVKLHQQNEPFRKLIQRLVDVCNAIHYAHSRGVLHRDIKPDNIMIGKYGETLVVDWGLARVSGQIEEECCSEAEISNSGDNFFETQAGTLLGTPQYMSPEQAAGRIDELGPTTDVYSIGATLFVLLTGQPAIQKANSRHQFLHRVITGEFRKPREVNPQIPNPLDSICRRAMMVNAEDRYQTALELGQDLERWLADQPVQAYKEPLRERALRWARQHQISMTVGTLCLLTVLISLAFALFAVNDQRQQAKQNAEQALAAQQRAESARRLNLENSARFLAQSIAYEIDLRWRMLESEVTRRKLRELVSEYNTSPRVDSLIGMPLDKPVDTSEWAELQSYLKHRFDAASPNIKCKSWTLTGEKGVQFARAPWGSSIGHHYGHRDYFHAKGADLKPGSDEAIAARPFNDRSVHMSAVFESTVTRNLMVAFGVPIYHPDDIDESGRPIGILMMSVELGDFDLENNAMLVETRVDQLTHERGLILHHKDLGLSSKNDLPPRLTTEYLQKILRWKEQRSRTETRKAIHILSDFNDPLTNYQGLAAIEPVIVNRKNQPASDTGWVVIVKEPETANNTSRNSEK